MKKLFILLFTFSLIACSAPISPHDIGGKIPENENKTIIFNVNSTENTGSNLIAVGILRSGLSNVTKQLSMLVSHDNLNIGISGKSQMLNKAATLYVIENVKFGQNTKLFMTGESEQDKLDLEKATKAKNIPFEYFLIQK